MNSIQRTLKKIKILLVLFLIIGGTTYLIFRPKPDPCFNGIQDGNETGVDCGGFCDAVCPDVEKSEYTENVAINWTTFTVDGKNNYDFASSISNKNIKWGASNVKYKFIAYDQNGEILKEIEGNTYLMPAGNNKDVTERYIIEDNVYMLETPDKVEIQLSDYSWQEITEEGDVTELAVDIISTSNPHYWFDEGRKIYMGGAYTKNNSKYSFKTVDIGAVLFGTKNNVIAIAKTNQLTMNSGDGWGFEVLWPNLKIEEDQIYNIETKASTNVFNEDNYIRDYKAE